MTAPSVLAIQQAVCAYRGITIPEIVGPCRAWRFAHPRQEAAYLCRQLTRSSLPRLGKMFGGRDHGTIHSGIKAVKRRAAKAPDYALDLWAMREWLRQPDHGRAEGLELWACRSIAAGLNAAWGCSWWLVFAVRWTPEDMPVFSPMRGFHRKSCRPLQSPSP